MHYQVESTCPRDEVRGVLELSPALTPRGLAVELHIYLCADGPQALWVSDDGCVLGEVALGKA